MRNMRERYDQLGAAAEAYNVGKEQLSAAITAKGVETSPTDSYLKMAENVNAISQETYEIDGGDMYAKQLCGSLDDPNLWNLYQILTQLLSDGRLVNYGGILLSAYNRGYNDLALSGAGAGGAYVVSDKDANGNFIMYTEDTIHTWNTNFDGKGNRWVAYCFADEYHGFQITDTNTSPRSIFIGRKVGTIASLVNGRVSQIVVPDGNSLDCFAANTFTQNWDKNIVIRGLKNQVDTLIRGAADVESVYIEADSMTTSAPSKDLFYITTANKLASLIIKCNTANNVGLFYMHSGLSSLGLIIIDGASGKIADSRDGGSGNMNLTNLKDLILNNVEDLIYDQTPYKNTNCLSYDTRVWINYATNDKTKTVRLTGNWLAQDVILKDGWCKPLNIAVLTELTEANMYAHILQKLKQDEPDCGDGITITLGSTNLAKLTSAESVQLLDDLTNIYGYTFA